MAAQHTWTKSAKAPHLLIYNCSFGRQSRELICTEETKQFCSQVNVVYDARKECDSALALSHFHLKSKPVPWIYGIMKHVPNQKWPWPLSLSKDTFQSILWRTPCQCLFFGKGNEQTRQAYKQKHCSSPCWDRLIPCMWGEMHWSFTTAGEKGKVDVQRQTDKEIDRRRVAGKLQARLRLAGQLINTWTDEWTLSHIYVISWIFNPCYSMETPWLKGIF